MTVGFVHSKVTSFPFVLNKYLVGRFFDTIQLMLHGRHDYSYVICQMTVFQILSLLSHLSYGISVRKHCPFSPHLFIQLLTWIIYDFHYLFGCSFGLDLAIGRSSCWLLCTFKTPHHFLSAFFLASQDVPGSSCTFPAPAMESAISQRNAGFFYWRRVFEISLGPRCTYCCSVSPNCILHLPSIPPLPAPPTLWPSPW